MDAPMRKVTLGLVADPGGTALERPVGLVHCAKLSWLAASLGTIAGALRSNFDSDEAIREATYSRRQHERRKLADSYED